jgi:CRISPR-associated protein Csd2
MNARKLFVFRHDSALGNAPAHKLFDLINVSRVTDNIDPARNFSDYEVSILRSALLPEGVTLEEKI